jgi:hypothetical protein
MTDRDETWGPLPEAGPLDELASALLDGEATAEEQARADEPQVAARMARFAAVASVVSAEPEAPADHRRDAAVAAALAAWQPQATRPEAPIDELASRRDRRTVRTFRLVGAAAAVAAVLGLGALVATWSQDDGDSTSSVAADAPTEGASDTTEAAAADEAAGGGDAAGSVPAPSVGGDLGRYDDVDALLRDSTAQFAQRAASSNDASPSTSPTADQLDLSVQCAPAVLSSPTPATFFTATLVDREVVVLLTPVAGGTHVVVVDATTCEVLAERTP